MSAPWLVVVASLLFATMGVCVKFAALHYGSGEIVMYRGLVGALMIGALSAWRRQPLRTAVPVQHFVRSLTGVIALCLWFYAIGALPLATAMTLNYTSSLWLAAFLIAGATLLGGAPVDLRLVLVAMIGFAGVVFVLQPTIERYQWWHGMAGLLSGLVSAAGYLQVAALGRAGEPEGRIVFYFSVGGIVGGAALAAFSGWHGHTWRGVGLLLAIGVLATVAQLLLTRAYARGRTLVNASLQYMGIAFSFLFGVFLFGDAVFPIEVAGMALIVGAGVAATRLRGSKPSEPIHRPAARRT